MKGCGGGFASGTTLNKSGVLRVLGSAAGLRFWVFELVFKYQTTVRLGEPPLGGDFNVFKVED